MLKSNNLINFVIVDVILNKVIKTAKQFGFTLQLIIQEP